MKLLAKIAANIARGFHLSEIAPSIYALFVIILAVASCSPAEPTVSPAEPTVSPAEADLTARKIAVELRRQSEVVPVGVDEHVPVHVGDRVQVDESGRALLRFRDHLLVELFRDTEAIVSTARLEPGGFIFVRLKQTFGFTRTRVESLADARVTVETDYATIRALDTGTELLLGHGKALTCIVALEGEAEVEAQGQTMMVRAGEATYILPDQPPEPIVCVSLEEAYAWADRKRGTEEVEPLGALVKRWAQEPCSSQAALPTYTPLPPTATPTAVQATLPPTATPPALLPTATPTPTLGIGSTRASEKDGMAMLYVPAGEFLMGSTSADKDAQDDEKPQHTVYLDAFWIDRTEVTNAMFARFVADANYRTDAEEQGWGWVLVGTEWKEVAGADWQHPQGPNTDITGFDNHPAVQVSWNDANAYCRWAGRQLPSEAQWEKAARGTKGQLYPWGNTFDGRKLNFCDANCLINWQDPDSDDGYASAAPVGSYPSGASPYGALDMAGNVWEWVIDWYGKDYYASSPGDNPPGPATGVERGLRGGAWNDELLYMRAADRSSFPPGQPFDTSGFRCVFPVTQ